ncbi:hypothetical protein EGW08_005342 [Elysia chlorotica]|uniref:OTU domain-containing protein n=1 Tax=Elysia chlorotica TaxID=188477 RepID=A0A433TZD9_ELYCH|nr:hypothetical protein EGW08_005342 [Elysia chlorotica]
MKAATVGTMVNGFRKCGIWPCDRDVFTEADFVFNTPSLHQQTNQMTTTLDQMTSAISATPTPGVISATPTPGVISATPNTAVISATTNTGVISATPNPGVISATPNPGAISAIPFTPTASNDQIACNTNTATSPERSSTVSNVDSTPQSHIFSPNKNTSVQFDKKIIPTNPDGRCFFRSVIIAQHKDLQTIHRDMNGNAVNEIPKLQEQIKADYLRAQTVQHMMNKLGEYSNDPAILNADMPSSKYSSMLQRISDMALPHTCIGEFEILATCEVLCCPINVHHKNGGNVLSYKPQSDNPFGQAINVLYTTSDDNCGHYECLMPVHVRVVDVSPLPFRPLITNKRKYRKSEAEVLTSSPYKKKLEDLMEKKNKTKKIQSKTQIKVKKSKVVRKLTPKSKWGSDSWYCFMCGESTEENMIKCAKCLRWVHEECAGTSGSDPNSYNCELC